MKAPALKERLSSSLAALRIRNVSLIIAGTILVYGAPAADLTSCVSDAGFPCPGGNRSIWQVMPGIWYSLVRGDQGSVALGLSYIHTRRALWSGLESLRPKGREDSFVTSIRYYLP